VIEHDHLMATACSPNGAHHAGCASAYDDHIAFSLHSLILH
jgi:hypothetical protein